MISPRSRLLTMAGAALLIGAASLAEPTPAAPEPGPAPAATDAAAITPLSHVVTRGTGPINVVLIPGVGCDWTVFDTFMTRNAERYTMYAVTLPGFGGGAPPPMPPKDRVCDGLWIENAVAAVMKHITDHSIEKPVIVGHSLGGHIAMRMAARHGDALRAVVVLDALPAFPLREIDQRMTIQERREFVMTQIEPWFRELSDDMWAEQQRMMADQMVKSRGRAAALGHLMSKAPRPVGMQYVLELMAADITEDMPRVSCPMLAISCITDEELAPGLKDKLRATTLDQFSNAANTDVVFFEDTRHFVMDDSPQALDETIDALLTGKPVRGKPAAPRPATSTPARRP